MSNDWWTSSSSSTPQQPFHTPQRPGQFQHSNSTNRSTRFSSNNVGDELDSEDLKMADSIKFLPSFANSPAGKLALGTSPQNSMSPSAGFGAVNNTMSMGGVGSPNEGRRSPGVRERVERDSPRHHRRSLLHQNSQLGSSSAFGGGMAIDEDMPPTASLRDSVNENGNGAMQIRNNEVNNAVDLPIPSTLLPNQSTTSLHIFGPPLPILSSLQPYLSQFGPITSFAPGPEGSNWYIVQYSNPVSASYALRRHGDILQGKYMIGFKVVNESSQNGFTQSPGQGQGQMTSSGVGTPIRVQEGKSIVKPRAAPVKKVVNANGGGGGNEYNWDDTEEEQKNGWGGWVSERLFGR
ncbi:hypothetical protein I302_109149 [Kwoniella bestiolae CBS 10118]|uniref:RRM Nup35-type domain-containing protein n=1 Tax=Kwoniella bestiolae CBS 10118 TaxID=1296100 RepID=A0A1B9FV57_9TREE|nr:hypothetical protein I302_08295 [Kwoniella bestiolae CBS 10118]OCF22644.1 hypothetical protein I302_08295 [Kwoniella bestiolae CBS 10118]